MDKSINIQRNYFFEFAGMPKSGKTTTVESVRHFYRRLGYNVVVFAGHDRTIGIDKGTPKEFDTALAAHIVKFLMINSFDNGKPCIFLLDRGPFDRSVFVQLDYQHNYISKEETKIITDFLLMNTNCSLIDGLFAFSVSPTESLKREYSNTIIEKPGRIMNTTVLQEYQQTLNKCYKDNCHLFKNVDWVDTTFQNPRETSIFIAKRIWTILGGFENEFPVF